MIHEATRNDTQGREEGSRLFFFVSLRVVSWVNSYPPLKSNPHSFKFDASRKHSWMSVRAWPWLLTLALVCAFNSTARAQDADARTRGAVAQSRALSGIVVDQSGAPVVGATVALRESGSASEELRTT